MTAEPPDVSPVTLVRYPHTQAHLEVLYKRADPPPVPLSQRIRSRCSCSAKDVGNFLLSLLPIVSVIRNYKLSCFMGDILSGVSSACLHFPQGLAFGLLASLAPSYGLYTSFFPVVIYVIFGSSQHLSVGTNAVIALFTSDLVRENVVKPTLNSIGNITNSSSGSDDSLDDLYLLEKASLASGATFLVGVILLALGLARLGFLTSYLSSSFVSAFTSTAAIHIISSQVPKALGVKIPPISGAGKLILVYIEIFKAITTANVCSVVTSIICIIILVFVKDFINEKYKDKMKMPVPIDLILVILATIISHFTFLNDRFGMAVVGDIPVGLPAPAFPTIRPSIIGNSVIIAVVIFVLNISMIRICEIKHGYQVSSDQELIAYGTSNLFSSFFWCFPSCTAPPRTVILSTMGAKTTINGVLTAIILLLILLVLGQYFTSLPVPVLAIMVIIAVKNLLTQLKQLPDIWRINKYDLVIWLGTFLSGVLIDFPFAIYIGVLLCLLTVVIQSQRGKSYQMSKLKKEELYLDNSSYSDLAHLPDVTVFKMESSLYFATTESFRSRLYQITGDPRKNTKEVQELVLNDLNNESDTDGLEKQQNGERLPKNENQERAQTMTSTHVIIDCSSFNYVDMSGISMLTQICNEFERAGVTIMFVRCTRYMLDIINRSALKKAIKEGQLYPDIMDAIQATKRMLKM
ncbi:hypothetical protein FSP39_017471 [Pinctada imbricata]|uniref:STAS domain-containing protein n=1 Tax=Pinctada imbricata TaxID=66713 RepID=A0AA89C6T3_PINIB|nr:hypothetical protein FSP39_017471 [Pinctada imbricata]